ncbi:hypothetical protein ACLOAV_008365 [Pseudogymnoascus australis]
MEVPTQIYSKALPSVQDMADAQFPEWFGHMAFASEDSSSYFDDAMDGIFGDRTVQWGRNWTNLDWSGPDNFWSPAPFEEMKGFPPVAMSLFQQPTEKTALELLQGRQGSSLTAGFEGHTSPDESELGPSVSCEDPESPVESDSGEPESREELRSPKSPSRLDSSDEPDLTQDLIPEALDSTEDSPKGLQSPEEQAEETLPRLLQDKNNSVGRPVAYETENLRKIADHVVIDSKGPELIGLTGPWEPVAVSPISGGREDHSQSDRSPSRLTNAGTRPLMKSVTVKTNIGDIPPPKSSKRKIPDSPLSDSPSRRVTRPKVSNLQYNTREAQFMEDSQKRIKDIIEGIKSGTSSEATILKLLSLEELVVCLSAFHDRAS